MLHGSRTFRHALGRGARIVTAMKISRKMTICIPGAAPPSATIGASRRGNADTYPLGCLKIEQSDATIMLTIKTETGKSGQNRFKK